MKIITHVGTHGTGKTVATLEHATKLKKEFSLLRVGVIVNTVRGCPFPINQDTTLESQLWILAALLKQEMELSLKNDIVVSDRSVYDVAAYCTVAGFFDMRNAILLLPRDHYSEIIYHDPHKNNYFYGDGVRDMNDGFRLAVGAALLEILRESNVNYRTWGGVIHGHEV